MLWILALCVYVRVYRVTSSINSLSLEFIASSDVHVYIQAQRCVTAWVSHIGPRLLSVLYSGTERSLHAAPAGRRDCADGNRADNRGVTRALVGGAVVILVP